jgi:hypothetical protein
MRRKRAFVRRGFATSNRELARYVLSSALRRNGKTGHFLGYLLGFFLPLAQRAGVGPLGELQLSD